MIYKGQIYHSVHIHGPDRTETNVHAEQLFFFTTQNSVENSVVLTLVTE